MLISLVPIATYVLVANPATYKLVRSILGDWVASADGLATLYGLILHAIVYVLVTGLVLVLMMPRTSMYDTPGPAPTATQKAQSFVASGLQGLASAVAPTK